MKMTILSLFDGISCGRVALERAGIGVDKYYASEIDKYAISVTQRHFPDTVQLGDINNFNEWDLPKIDLIIGGSPCQDLSIAGKRKGLSGDRSGLFWRYVDCLNKFKPKFFLLENNFGMPKEAQDEITRQLGVEPILINSSCVSAQNRKRLYWTNIKVGEIKQKSHQVIRDILERKVDEKYYMNYPLVLKDGENKGNLVQIGEIPNTALKDNERQRRVYSVDGISPTILARADSPKILCVGKLDMKASEQVKRVYSPLGLAPTVDTAQGGHRQIKILEDARIRKLTPTECERLQTLPNGYTVGLSDTQRYKCIGNGWTVDVIAHIFKHLKDYREE